MKEKEIKELLLNIGVYCEEKPRLVVANLCEEALDYIVELEAENAKLKQDINKIKADAIRGAAHACCPASGYVVRDEQARKDLEQYADFIEKQLPINLVENAND